MGTFTTGGIAAELDKFDKLARGTDKACEKAVKAGGKLLAEKLAKSAPVYSGTHKDVKPGALRDSIKAGKVSYNAGDGWHCEVAPTGQDHGQSLAKIGNILEYGRSGGKGQRVWFHPTVDAAAAEVTDAMKQAFTEAVGK
ncbi:MAG: HK97 gp10 family phage protein [Clostridia bacterium]|nr:HK97 gp10 family phage protein [Clostridia bacterium]